MTRKQMMQKIEEYTKSLGIFVKTVKSFNYDPKKYEISIVYQNIPQKTQKLREFVWSLDKENEIFEAYLISEESYNQFYKIEAKHESQVFLQNVS